MLEILLIFLIYWQNVLYFLKDRVYGQTSWFNDMGNSKKEWSANYLDVNHSNMHGKHLIKMQLHEIRHNVHFPKFFDNFTQTMTARCIQAFLTIYGDLTFVICVN